MWQFPHKRWGDNDKYFGPFTFSYNSTYRRYTAVLNSGDNDDNPGCSFRLSISKFTFIVALPAIIKPHQERVYAKYWDEETIQRLGRDYYIYSHENEYGFSYHEGHLSISFGPQTNDSITEKRWGTFLPWTQWRFVRESLYDLSGNHFWTSQPNDVFITRYEESSTAKLKCPVQIFTFRDYDGECLLASTQIEEREWRFVTGWFEWLSWFKQPKITRSLCIEFSGETGSRKGSWKGGTTGHSIEMLIDELHESAFRRYCTQHNMIFGVGINTDQSTLPTVWNLIKSVATPIADSFPQQLLQRMNND